ncbi:unnamed protein product [Cuscuta epithymum]|uniref:Transcription elongation factor 1 homolog n=1 Tax=Cuscuta epithymum TaxID=186058 RepID=A0AAV0CCK5_9ASTE|nr:unnamed protein product [Cuscuta epithymum]
MGKRKSRAKPAPKKRMDKLDTVFDCPFCCNVKSVECRIDMKSLIAEAHCSDCKESYSTTATALTEAIDVYSEWIDECERVNNLEDDDDLRTYKRGGSREEQDIDDLDDDIRGSYKRPRQELGGNELDDEDDDDIRSYNKRPSRLEQDDDLEEEGEYEDDDEDLRSHKMPSRRVHDLDDEEVEEEEEEDEL